MRVPAFLAAIVLFLGTTVSPTSSQGLSGKLVVLSPGSRVLVIDVASQSVVADTEIAPGSTASWGSVAAAAKGKTAFASLWMPGSGEMRAIEIGPTRGALRVVATFPASEDVPWLEVGQRSGRLYLVSKAADDIRVFDPLTGRQTARMRGMPRTDVYALAVSADERRLYVSYHGRRPSGIDWFSLQDSSLIRCAPASSASGSCIPSHGFFVAHRGGVLADLSGGMIRQLDSAGREMRTMAVGLPGNHMVTFAVDSVSDVVYSLGDCNYTGGLSATSLRGDAGIERFHAERVCGSIVRLSVDRTWLAIPTLLYGYGAGSPFGNGPVTSITIIETRTGRTLATIRTPVVVENLIAIR
jgi:hypothetical protein